MLMRLVSYSPRDVSACIYLHDFRGYLVHEVEMCIVVEMLLWSLVLGYLHSSCFIPLFLESKEAYFVTIRWDIPACMSKAFIIIKQKTIGYYQFLSVSLHAIRSHEN